MEHLYHKITSEYVPASALILKIMMKAKHYQLKVFTPTTKFTEWILISSQATWTDPISRPPPSPKKICLANDNHTSYVYYCQSTTYRKYSALQDNNWKWKKNRFCTIRTVYQNRSTFKITQHLTMSVTFWVVMMYQGVIVWHSITLTPAVTNVKIKLLQLSAANTCHAHVMQDCVLRMRQHKNIAYFSVAFIHLYATIWFLNLPFKGPCGWYDVWTK